MNDSSLPLVLGIATLFVGIFLIWLFSALLAWSARLVGADPVRATVGMAFAAIMIAGLIEIVVGAVFIFMPILAIPGVLLGVVIESLVYAGMFKFGILKGCLTVIVYNFTMVAIAAAIFFGAMFLGILGRGTDILSQLHI